MAVDAQTEPSGDVCEPVAVNLSPATRILAVIVSQREAMFASLPLDMCEPLQLGIILFGRRERRVSR